MAGIPSRSRASSKIASIECASGMPNGWQRQGVPNAMNRVWGPHAQLGDGVFPVRGTIAKAFGLDAATRPRLVPGFEPNAGNRELSPDN